MRSDGSQRSRASTATSSAAERSCSRATRCNVAPRRPTSPRPAASESTGSSTATSRQSAATSGATALDGGSPAATFDPACARVHPAKLVRGLARVVEARGVSLFERTEVLDWSAGRVRFRSLDGGDAEGTIVAKHVIVATEGYGPGLPARATADPAPLLAHDRDRAALRRRVGRDRHRARPDVQRLPAPAHLRPAHRRQPLRLRRPRGELPLGQRGRSGVRAGRPGVRAPARRAARPLPRSRRGPRDAPMGRTPRRRP